MTPATRVTSPRLIVALDAAEYTEAESLVERLAPLGVMFKVGLEALFGYGERIRARLEHTPGGYFIDAKLHDIPRTVGAAVRTLVHPGVRIINVHALGGAAMMEAAVQAAATRAEELEIEAPEIFAVTILTSIAPEDLRELGLSGGPGENAIRLAALARDARCAGVICGAHEVAELKSFFGTEFATLVPGIRPAGAAHDDQKRAATPRDAAQAGADYLVVGRPITRAADPFEAAQSILAEMRT
ncbi:MAG: orotidine-5'-phosphate decarboxylase [Candidatus Eremiobacteraeota bacterium]|nr:orotidine-5'-phosphate decarboxylase [Candidatus Eremiobacteraeota bacterium]